MGGKKNLLQNSPRRSSGCQPEKHLITLGRISKGTCGILIDIGVTDTARKPGKNGSTDSGSDLVGIDSNDLP